MTRMERDMDPTSDVKTARCTRCRAEFSEREIMQNTTGGCPKCGTHGVPMAVSQDTEVKINWHELRILIIWAENWERHVHAKQWQSEDGLGVGVVASIARELSRFRKEGWPALTLFGEIEELKKEYPGLQVVTEGQPPSTDPSTH